MQEKSRYKVACNGLIFFAFVLWTSLGLNQGPPDYEAVAEHDKSCGFIVCNQLSYKTF
ncbi:MULTISPECIES: hypothetical protein [Bacteria]|uniref:hypothetical protein n=1 Tax=Bacteria TaxID=2 RepID=UPI0023A8FCE5|nr:MULTISPECIES: hypothetical protein [Bacteria]